MVPYVLDGDGNCHVYVDGAADLSMALDIVVNAKTHRDGVCNAAETVLVDATVAGEFLPRMAEALMGAGASSCVVTSRRVAIVAAMVAAQESDWGTEYLGPTLAVGVVDGIGAAIEHITQYSSGHSEAIRDR